LQIIARFLARQLYPELVAFDLDGFGPFEELTQLLEQVLKLSNPRLSYQTNTGFAQQRLDDREIVIDMYLGERQSHLQQGLVRRKVAYQQPPLKLNQLDAYDFVCW
jgi:hypothetical protein